MREGRANGGVDREGGGADADAAAPTEAAPRQKQPQSNPSSSGSAASSSSGRGGAAEEEQGGKNKQGRRKSKRREDVVRAIRDRLPAAPACWGNVSVVQERRGRRERPDDHGRNGRVGAVEVEEEVGAGSGARTAAAPAWCCICPEGDCSLEANPSANGKEEPGLRSLLERNDFYSDDCNPHGPAAAANDDEDMASQAADFD